MSKKPKVTFSTFGGWNIWGPTLVFVILAFAGMAKGQDVPSSSLEMRLLDCVADERAMWSVVGTADFVGDPWTHTWTTNEEWNNATGKMVAITPVLHTFPVPGEQLKVEFEDGSTFVYGEPLTDKNRVVWADNLGSLALYGMEGLPPPYVTIKRTTGEIILLQVQPDGTCGWGWYLKHPD